MAKHDGVIMAATIWENRERRFSYLYTEEHYSGQDAEEYEVFARVLFEPSEEDDFFQGRRAVRWKLRSSLCWCGKGRGTMPDPILIRSSVQRLFFLQ